MQKSAPRRAPPEIGPDELSLSALKFQSVISYSDETILFKVSIQPDLGTVYACKKILLNRLPESQRNRREELELNLSAVQKLVHPHVIRCHKVFALPSALYTILTYYPLGSIQDRLNRLKRPLPLKSSRVWFAQTLGAVSYVHTRGMAHRNLKLSCILLHSEEQAILSGFTNNCLAYRRTTDIMRTTVFKRNLAYQAPEMHMLLASVWPYDAKAIDMYALGVCLFIMVNLQPPFDVDLYASDQVAYITKQRNHDFVFSEQYAKHTNSKMKQLIRRLLEHKPGIRISASSALMHEALLPE